MVKIKAIMRFAKALIAHPPTALIAGEDDLTSVRREWIQEQGWWLLMVYQHRGSAFVNAVNHQIKPGTALLYPPGSRGSHIKIGAGTPHIYFQFMLSEQGTNSVALPIHSELDRETVELCSQRAALVSHRLAPIKAFLWNLLWSLASDSRLVGLDDRLFNAETFIDQHLNEPLTVGEVCEAVHVPYRTLTRLFEAEHGIGINRYIFRRRSREAVRLLSETSLSFKSIAAKVGVSDPHQFNKLIRKAVGISPTQVRIQAANIGIGGYKD